MRKTLNTDEEIWCWIVWQSAEDGGRPYLVAVDTTEARARVHAKAIRDEARILNKTILVRIEKSVLNHRYGESMGQTFDLLKKNLKKP